VADEEQVDAGGVVRVASEDAEALAEDADAGRGEREA
jgi:hypothetical protein